MSDPEVVTLGEAMVLLLADDEGPLRESRTFRRTIAGAESNAAIGLARLGHRVRWISRLGDDEFGAVILEKLRAENIDVSGVTLDPARPTGVLFRDRWPGHPVSVSYYRTGSAASAMSPTDLHPDQLLGASFVLVTGITAALSASCLQLVIAAMEMARDRGVRTAFDPNFRARLWSASQAHPVLLDLASRADIVVATEDEMRLLGFDNLETGAQTLLNAGVDIVVVKRGVRGVTWATADDPSPRTSTIGPVVAHDPVGAGDAFMAGFLAGALETRSVTSSIELGQRCAASVVSTRGDVEGLPRQRDIEAAAHADDVVR